MKSLRCADLTAADIREIVTVQEQPLAAYPWTQVDPLVLSDQEREHIAYIQQRLRIMDTSLMNEATIWGRAIYPMLILAEQGPVQAWVQVTLRVRYPHVELHGVVDGVLGRGLLSMTEKPIICWLLKQSVDWKARIHACNCWGSCWRPHA